MLPSGAEKVAERGPAEHRHGPPRAFLATMSAPLSAGARVPSPNYGSAANAPRTAKPTSTAGRAAAAADRAIDAVSVRPRFQYVAAAILGIGNASDAVEVLCLSFVLDAYDVSDAEKGARRAAGRRLRRGDAGLLRLAG